MDRALEYAALAADGMRAAEIARRRRRSKAHVSILLRLGHVLQGCTPEELAVVRAPQVTWKLAQRIVRADVPDAAIRERLRLAVGGFSSYTVDRRRNRKGRPGAAGALRQPAGTYQWQWDAAWAARDPLGYVEAYRAFLGRMHRDVSARLRTGVMAAGGSPTSAGAPLAGQSLRQLTAAVGQRGAPQPRRAVPAEREALLRLAELDPALLAGAAVRDAEQPDGGRSMPDEGRSMPNGPATVTPTSTIDANRSAVRHLEEGRD